MPISEKLTKATMAEERDEATCPSCGEGHLDIKSMLYSVPHFNELAVFTMKCPVCNFSHNDVFSTESREPARWTLSVNDPSKLHIRVVRSSSGTIRFPEFGIDVEPGPSAEGFITNVEGVLLRTKPIIEMAVRFAETNDQKQNGEKIVKMLTQAREGKLSFTLILEDPTGVSGILTDDMALVKYEELSPKEASELKGAPIWIDSIREGYKERKG